MNKQIGFHFGALSDSIAEQIKKHGFKSNAKDVLRFDAQADAIVTLSMGGILTDSAKDKCLSKLHANIVKHICKENGLKPVKTFTK